jgi:hypothetical protein
MKKTTSAIPSPVTILEEAIQRVDTYGQEAYGPARENFQRWRDMCRATGRPGLVDISAEDLAIVMILLKVSRETQEARKDNCVDIAGYASLLNDVRGE